MRAKMDFALLLFPGLMKIEFVFDACHSSELVLKVACHKTNHYENADVCNNNRVVLIPGQLHFFKNHYFLES